MGVRQEQPRLRTLPSWGEGTRSAAELRKPTAKGLLTTRDLAGENGGTEKEHPDSGQERGSLPFLSVAPAFPLGLSLTAPPQTPALPEPAFQTERSHGPRAD